MKKSKIGAIVVALVAVLAVVFDFWSTGPFYENQSIEDWF